MVGHPLHRRREHLRTVDTDQDRRAGVRPAFPQADQQVGHRGGVLGRSLDQRERDLGAVDPGPSVRIPRSRPAPSPRPSPATRAPLPAPATHLAVLGELCPSPRSPSPVHRTSSRPSRLSGDPSSRRSASGQRSWRNPTPGIAIVACSSVAQDALRGPHQDRDQERSALERRAPARHRRHPAGGRGELRLLPGGCRRMTATEAAWVLPRLIGGLEAITCWVAAAPGGTRRPGSDPW